MSGLPYVSIPTLAVELPLVGRTVITVFGPLVAVGVVLGHRLAMRWARTRGLHEGEVDRLAVGVAVGGFAVAHWFSALLYYPEQVAADPWILLYIHRGLSSVGGFIGGALTFAWLAWRRRLSVAEHADLLAYGLLAGFTIGRLGCTLVHDHPGALASADSLLAVGPWPDGAYRFDLGLVELLLLLPVCTWVYARVDPARAQPGRLAATLAVTYAILRFPLDFLRAEDLRYGLLTPAQYACLVFVALGLAVVWRQRGGSCRSVG